MLSIEFPSDAIVDACIGHEAAERLRHSANGRDASVLEFMAAASVSPMMALAGSTQRERMVREPLFQPGRLFMTSGVQALIQPHPGLIEPVSLPISTVTEE